MKFKKKILVFTTLFMILGCNLALATSQTPSGESGDGGSIISGDTTPSGETGNIPVVPSGDTEPSGDEPSGDSGDSFTDILNSIALDSTFTIDVNHVLQASFDATVSGDETFNFVVLTEASHGIVSQETVAEPLFSYVPEKDYIGNDSFTFRLESGDLFSNVATVTIKIEGPSEPIIPFYYEDMQEHWANYSASHLAARGIVIGEEINDNFYYYPDKKMTRAEFLLFIMSVLDVDNSGDVATFALSGDNINSGDVKFADKDEMPSWLLEKVKLAYQIKLISGVSKNNEIYFNPNSLITRGEAFVMINNALLIATNTKNSTTKLNYTDADTVPTWASQAVQNLTAYKIIQGSSDNKININNITTRGEAAELSYKLLKQIETIDLNNSSGDLK